MEREVLTIGKTTRQSGQGPNQNLARLVVLANLLVISIHQGFHCPNHCFHTAYLNSYKTLALAATQFGSLRLFSHFH